MRSVQVLLRGGPQAAASTRDVLRSFIEAGVTHVVLGLVPPYEGSPVAWLAEEIVEPLLAEGDAGTSF